MWDAFWYVEISEMWITKIWILHTYSVILSLPNSVSNIWSICDITSKSFFPDTSWVPPLCYLLSSSVFFVDDWLRGHQCIIWWDKYGPLMPNIIRLWLSLLWQLLFPSVKIVCLSCRSFLTWNVKSIACDILLLKTHVPPCLLWNFDSNDVYRLFPYHISF